MTLTKSAIDWCCLSSWRSGCGVPLLRSLCVQKRGTLVSNSLSSFCSFHRGALHWWTIGSGPLDGLCTAAGHYTRQEVRCRSNAEKLFYLHCLPLLFKWSIFFQTWIKTTHRGLDLKRHPRLFHFGWFTLIILEPSDFETVHISQKWVGLHELSVCTSFISSIKECEFPWWKTLVSAPCFRREHEFRKTDILSVCVCVFTKGNEQTHSTVLESQSCKDKPHINWLYFTH